MFQNNHHNRSSQVRSRFAQPLQNALNRRNRSDTFQVNLPDTSSFRASLSGINPKANVNLELLNSKGKIVAASRKQGHKSESLNLSQLEAGTYKLRAVLKQGQKTTYRLSFNSTVVSRALVDSTATSTAETSLGLNTTAQQSSASSQPDLGGNSPLTATNWGKLGSTVSTIADAVGNGDDADWYVFNVGESGFSSNRLNLNLTGDMSVSAQLYNASDLTQPLGTAVASNASSNPFSDANVALPAGTYYVRVNPLVAGSTANYKLNLTSNGIADAAGNSKETARVINNLQPLNTSGQSFTFTDFVGTGDAVDYYTFNTSKQTTFTLKFDRLNQHNLSKARILHQLEKVGGLPGSGVVWKNASGVSLSSGISALTEPSYTLTGTLEPGTYTLQLKSFFYEGDNDYQITFSANEGISL